MTRSKFELGLGYSEVHIFNHFASDSWPFWALLRLLWESHKSKGLSTLKNKYLHDGSSTAIQLDQTLLRNREHLCTFRMLHVPSEAHPWFLVGQWPCSCCVSAMISSDSASLNPPLGANICRFLYLESSNGHRGKRRKPWHRMSLWKTWVKHEGVGWLTRGQLVGAQGQSTLGQGVQRINHEQMLTPSSAWF